MIDEENDISDGVILQEDQSENKKSNQNDELPISNTDHKGPIENELLIVEMTNNKENEDESDDEEDEM